MPAAMLCAERLRYDILSLALFLLVMGTVYVLLSSTRCEKHEARRRTSTEILRFTTLRRDEGYLSLELDSDNKAEASLLHSNAFFYVRKRYRQNYSSRNGFRDGFKQWKHSQHRNHIFRTVECINVIPNRILSHLRCCNLLKYTNTYLRY